MLRSFHNHTNAQVAQYSGTCFCQDPTKEKNKRGMILHIRELSITAVIASKNMTSESLNEILVVAETSADEIGQCQVKNCLEWFKKTSSESLLEITLGGAHEHKVKNTQFNAIYDNDAIFMEGCVSLKWLKLAITAKVMLWAMLKLKFRLILACDSTHEVLWNRWPLHVLGVIDCFHSFCPIFYLLERKEDDPLSEHLPRSVAEFFLSN